MGETVYSFGADFPSEPFCTGNTLCGVNVTINAAARGANVFSKKSFVLDQMKLAMVSLLLLHSH